MTKDKLGFYFGRSLLSFNVNRNAVEIFLMTLHTNGQIYTQQFSVFAKYAI